MHCWRIGNSWIFTIAGIVTLPVSSTVANAGTNPIAAVKVETGYEIAWKNTGAGSTTFTLWGTDAKGDLTRTIANSVPGSDPAIASAEALFQQDINVMWDLAVHDLSIMDFVIGINPVAVSATGLSHVPGQPANVAFMTLFFDRDIIAHINVNWLSPVKIRRTLVGGSKRMIVYDDLETSEKVKIYDKGITVTETPDDLRKLLISYRTGDLWSPKVSETEALRAEVAHFRNCIEGSEKPITSGERGLAIVRMLEAADRSMQSRGEAIELSA